MIVIICSEVIFENFAVESWTKDDLASWKAFLKIGDKFVDNYKIQCVLPKLNVIRNIN